MEEFEGTIEVAGSSYRVTGVIEIRERNGLKKWGGFFQSPQGADFTEKSEGPFILKLDDDRSGSVMVAGTDVDSSGTVVVDFLGSGPLQ